MKEIMNFLPELLRINLVASFVILIVLVARLILKRAPKVFSYALWAIVLIRLLIPVSMNLPKILRRWMIPLQDTAVTR